jgi:hypothetical protein
MIEEAQQRVRVRDLRAAGAAGESVIEIGEGSHAP